MMIIYTLNSTQYIFITLRKLEYDAVKVNDIDKYFSNIYGIDLKRVDTIEFCDVATESECVTLHYVSNTNKRMCHWKSMDLGMYGCPDHVYKTTCGKEYDHINTMPGKYCTNCGNKIILE